MNYPGDPKDGDLENGGVASTTNSVASTYSLVNDGGDAWEDRWKAVFFFDTRGASGVIVSATLNLKVATNYAGGTTQDIYAKDCEPELDSGDWDGGVLALHTIVSGTGWKMFAIPPENINKGGWSDFRIEVPDAVPPFPGLETGCDYYTMNAALANRPSLDLTFAGGNTARIRGVSPGMMGQMI